MLVLNEVAKRWPRIVGVVMVIVIAAAVFASSASARTPTGWEWYRAAIQQASRQCNAVERSYPTVDWTGRRKVQCVRTGAWGPSAMPNTLVRNLNNDVASAVAGYAIHFNWGHYAGMTRLMTGRVHMHVARYVWRTRGGRRVLLPVIAIEIPVDWRASGWINTQG